MLLSIPRPELITPTTSQVVEHVASIDDQQGFNTLTQKLRVMTDSDDSVDLL